MTSTAGAITQFFSGFDFAANKTTIVILGVVAAVTALAIAIVTLTGRAREFQASMSSVNNSVNQMTGTASIPRYARGTTYHPGGLATINDGGGYPGETVLLPRGTRVYPAAQGGNGVTNNYITIDAKNVREFNDIIRITQNQRQSQRMGYVGAV